MVAGVLRADFDTTGLDEPVVAEECPGVPGLPSGASTHRFGQFDDSNPAVAQLVDDTPRPQSAGSGGAGGVTELGEQVDDPMVVVGGHAVASVFMRWMLLAIGCAHHVVLVAGVASVPTGGGLAAAVGALAVAEAGGLCGPVRRWWWRWWGVDATRLVALGFQMPPAVPAATQPLQLVRGKQPADRRISHRNTSQR